jgi:hypothetical protein
MAQQIIARRDSKVVPYEGTAWADAEQGFIDQHCNFLTREQAWKIAEKHGQIVNHPEWQSGTLHSEHLY